MESAECCQVSSEFLCLQAHKCFFVKIITFFFKKSKKMLDKIFLLYILLMYSIDNRPKRTEHANDIQHCFNDFMDCD